MAVDSGGIPVENPPLQTATSEDTPGTALMFAENFSTEQAPRKSSFNSDWRFFLGDNAAASKKEFDDSAWRNITLPHDYSIEQDFNKDSPSIANGGFLDGGVGWYRKTFVLPAAMADKQISIAFGGVYMDSTTYVNGSLVGNYPYGYSTFAYDITDKVVADGVTQNVIAVKVNNRQKSSRWYSGSGIYRNVDLIVTDPVHVKRYGTFVTTPNLETEYGNEQAVVNVKTKVQNDGDTAVNVIVKSTIYDNANGIFSETAVTEPMTAATGAEISFEQNITTAKPALWSVDNPNLYTLVTTVEVDGLVTDRYETPFGFRWFNVTPNDGFSLNGEYMKLNGVCMHHDQGALGAVANYRAIERQLEIMKDMGVNSIRVTHNPAADELLELCDRMGLLVIDEAFDCWETGKSAYDYGRFFSKAATHPNASEGQTWAEFDIKNMVERGKNNPSIIMWSIGNEIVNASVGTAQKLNDWVKEVDTTRLTTQGYNTFIDGFDKNWDSAKVANVTDVAGFNYGEKNATFDKAHEQLPDWVIMGSETSSAVRSRGYYKQDDEKRICNSYDVQSVGWGSTMEKSWQRNRDRKWILGEYMWTGFDYIGEPSPHNSWPSKNSYFGAVDTAGIPKDAFYMYQSVWTDAAENPMVHLMPHWNWEGDAGYDIKDRDGNIRVQAYTNAASVELYFNGELLSEQTFDQLETDYGMTYQEKNDHIYLEWQVPYQPGELKAIAYNLAGDKVAEDIIRTSSAPAQIRLTPDREVITADGSDLSYILVEVLDKDGNLVPTADNLINFRLSGNGVIAGVDNGDQTAVDERYQDNKRKVFNGKAMLIVQSIGEAGSISVTATAAGLASAKTTVFTNADVSGAPTLLGYEALSDVKTALNTQPTLPENIKAVYSDGSRNSMQVTWDNISEQTLSTPGQITVKGIVNDTGDTVVITVIVMGVLGLQEITVVTPVGTVPTLPDKVTAVYNTGETRSVDVVWDRVLTQEDVLSETVLVIEGTAAGFTQKAKATVRVKAGAIVFKNDIAKRDGTYPIPTASFVGGDPVTAINDGGVYYSSGPSGGRWIPWGNQQLSEWCQLEFEQEHIIGKAAVDIWNNTSDTAMSLPDTLTVQYSSDGENWSDAASKTQEEIDNVDGATDQKAMDRVFFDFSDNPVTAKFIRWKFDNAAKKSTGVGEVHVYEQSMELPVETGAKLSSISVGGTPLEGFSPDISAYTVPLAYGAQVPVVTAVAQGNATLFITPALDANKATTITVTGEDGKTVSYYTIQFQQAEPALETVTLSLGTDAPVEDDVLPVILTATMQDGSVLPAGVINVDYVVGDNRIAKVENGMFYAYHPGTTTLKATVTYNGVTVESSVLELTIAPNTAGKIITGYEKVMVTTAKGEAPQLPSEVTATFNIGLPKTVAVTWDEIPPESYAAYGSFFVKGTVEGQALRPTATVQVQGIVGVQQFSTATPVRFIPELAAKARVYYSDGTVGELPIVWEDCEQADFGAEGEIVTVHGSVDADGDTLSTATTVRVSANTRDGDTFTQYKNGFYLPLPFASNTNSQSASNTVDKIYDGVTTSDTLSNSSGQNCWNNWASTARTEDYAGFVFGLEEVVDKSLNQLDVYFYSDSGIEAPESCVIQYYSGQPFTKDEISQYPENNLPDDHLLAQEDNWTDVPNLVAPDALTAHEKNTFTFDAVSTCAIRVKMTAQSGKSLGIIEMQAHAKLVDDISTLTELTDIQLDGVSIAEFAPEITEYTCTVEGTALPSITAETGNNNEAVTVVTANTAKVIVTAEDGVAVKTYTIHMQRPDLPPEGSKTFAELQVLIAQAEKLLAEGFYTDASKGVLREVVNLAKQLTQDATLSETTMQYNAVQSAIEQLMPTINKQILAFTIPGQRGNTLIDESKGTVNVTMPQGSDVTALTPTIVVSEGASVTPASGAAQNFTQPVVYTVTAPDGSTQRYTVTVEVYVAPYNPPSGGGGGQGASDEKKNPDGSSTTTVTDKVTGTVTETTKWPDGKVLVIITQKDGTVTEKVSSPDGTHTEQVTKTDGSVTTNQTWENGTNITSNTTGEGVTTATVTVPLNVGEVTVTIPTRKPPKAGEVAMFVLEDGSKAIVKTSVPTEAGMRVRLLASAKLEIVDNTKVFSDVEAGHWAANAVQFTTSRELFNGVGNERFGPSEKMSRAMLFTVLARLDGQVPNSGDAWYTGAMAWAKSKGISDGTNPDGIITREQLATMLYRYAAAPNAVGESTQFADSANISDWAKAAMNWATTEGIVSGDGNSLLNPGATATRAEVATMLQRFIFAQHV